MQLMCILTELLVYSCHGLATEGKIKTRSLPSKLEVPIFFHLHPWCLDSGVVLELAYPLSVPLFHKTGGKKEPWSLEEGQLTSCFLTSTAPFPKFHCHQVALLFTNRKKTAQSLTACGALQVIVPTYVAQYHINTGNQHFQYMLFSFPQESWFECLGVQAISTTKK